MSNNQIILKEITPLHQFSASEIVLVKLGRNLDQLDRFIWGSIDIKKTT